MDRNWKALKAVYETVNSSNVRKRTRHLRTLERCSMAARTSLLASFSEQKDGDDNSYSSKSRLQCSIFIDALAIYTTAQESWVRDKDERHRSRQEKEKEIQSMPEQSQGQPADP